MAGPLDLRGRVIITDGASRTLNTVKGRLEAVAGVARRTQGAQAAIVAGAAAINKSAATLAGSAVGAYGILRVIERAEAFNRAVYGVGTAAIADNTREVTDSLTGLTKVVVDLDKVRESMAQVEGVTLRLSKELGQTPSRLGGIAEVLAKAGFGTEKLEAATKALAVVSSTDLETPASKLAEFASVLDTIYKPRQGEAWGDFFKRQMDIVRVAAGETRLSVGSMMEGLRPFSALYSILGGNESDNALMLMAGVKAGGEATEVGHTLKSNATRFLRMSQEGQSRFAALGLRRGDYTDFTSLDPMRATGNLSRLFPGARLRGNLRTSLNAEFQKAIEGGYYDSDDFHDRIMKRLAKAARVDMRDELSREKFTEKYNNAVFGSGAKVDMMKLYRDLIERGATSADLATIFEGRRIGTNTQIFEGLKEHGGEYERKLRMASGVGLDATQKVFDESAYGRLQRFYSLLEKFQIQLANSAGFEMFLNNVTRTFDLLGSIPEPLLNIATVAGVLTIALAPVVVAFGVLSRLAGPIGRLAGMLPGAAAATGAAMSPIAAAAAAAAGKTIGPGQQIPASARAAMATGTSPAAAAAALAAGGTGAALWWAKAKGLGAGAARVGAYMVPGLGQAMMARDLYKGFPALLGRGGGLLARLTPGLALLGLLSSVYSGVSKFRETGSVREGVKEGSGYNALRDLAAWFFGGTSAQASEAPGRGMPDIGPDPSRMPWLGQSSSAPGAAAGPEGEAQQTADRVRQVFAQVDLSAEGQRMMRTLADGIRAGMGEVVAAANEAASSARNAVALNVGPSMAGAR